MTTKSTPATDRPRLKARARHTPAVAGSLALGAGLTISGAADAALIIRDIGQTVTQGNVLALDLNQDGSDDVTVNVGPSDSIGVENIAGVVSVGYTKTPLVSMLQVGDEVDADWFDGTMGSSANAGNLYLSGSHLGGWNTIGDHGYVAFALDVGEVDPQYAWLEVTRGSAILGRGGYQTTLGAAAPVTAAPAPASPALLATGAAGLLGMRRRRRSARAAR